MRVRNNSNTKKKFLIRKQLLYYLKNILMNTVLLFAMQISTKSLYKCISLPGYFTTWRAVTSKGLLLYCVTWLPKWVGRWVWGADPAPQQHRASGQWPAVFAQGGKSLQQRSFPSLEDERHKWKIVWERASLSQNRYTLHMAKFKPTSKKCIYYIHLLVEGQKSKS